MHDAYLWISLSIDVYSNVLCQLHVCSSVAQPFYAEVKLHDLGVYALRMRVTWVFMKAQGPHHDGGYKITVIAVLMRLTWVCPRSECACTVRPSRSRVTLADYFAIGFRAWHAEQKGTQMCKASISRERCCCLSHLQRSAWRSKVWPINSS